MNTACPTLLGIRRESVHYDSQLKWAAELCRHKWRSCCDSGCRLGWTACHAVPCHATCPHPAPGMWHPTSAQFIRPGGTGLLVGAPPRSLLTVTRMHVHVPHEVKSGSVFHLALLKLTCNPIIKWSSTLCNCWFSLLTTNHCMVYWLTCCLLPLQFQSHFPYTSNWILLINVFLKKNTVCSKTGKISIPISRCQPSYCENLF